MRTKSSLLAVVASIAALASRDALADTSWTFTKGPLTEHAIASTQGLDAMVFTVNAPTAGAPVTRMAFMVTGTVRASEVANFRLLYYPSGLTGTAWVVGSTTASGIGQSAIVDISLASPLTFTTGVFALRVDVNGSRSFFFQPQLQSVAVTSNGVERYLLAETEDLPLPGDSFHVN